MTKTSSNLYQHYHPDDREFIDRASEWLHQVEATYHFVLTPFLNPHQLEIVEQLTAYRGLQFFASSSFWPSEEARAILAPDYYSLELEDFQIELLEISYPSKFYQLRHGQILGTFLHQLGVERWTFGDILVGNGQAQMMVDTRFSQYVIDHISKIAKVPVQLKKINLDQMLQLEQELKSRDILVSSLRLDKLVAESFRLSRKQAVELIASRQVKVNYGVLDNPSRPLQLGDWISVRKFGRIHLIEDRGLSKSGKHKLRVELLLSK